MIPVLLAAAAMISGCDFFYSGDSPAGGSEDRGEIILGFDRTDYTLTTKAVAGLKDSTEFLLTVTASDGTKVYDGKYGSAPASLSVGSGTYNLSLRSIDFSSPAFSSPQFGDEQCIVVKAGQKVKVNFMCEQLNCGIKLTFGNNFKSAYQSSYVYIQSSQGKLLYALGETRAAYFKPGTLSVVLSDGATTKELFKRSLQARQMLSLKIDCSSASSGSSGGGSGAGSQSFSVQIDTSRVWSSASINIDTGTGSGGSDSGGADVSDAYSVAEAKTNIGDTDVWVYGYIVGGDLTSSSMRFDTPFSSATNIAIAGRSSVSAKDDCMSIQLTSGSIREALNLRDNPSNLGRKVFLKGDIVEAYYGIPGLKNITDFQLQ